MRTRGRQWGFVTLLLLMLLLLAGQLHAQETLFYKCTDAQGKVSMQNGTPCAAGMQQDVRKIGEVKTMPAAAAAKPNAAQDTPQVTPQVTPQDTPQEAAPQYGEFVQAGAPRVQHSPVAEAAGLPPPPALFQCTTWKGESYLGDTDNPAPRCAPLQVVGIDGSAALGMGEACEMKADRCEAIPAPQLCEAWYRRLDDADFKLRYAEAATHQERQATFDAIAGKIKASHCATSVADSKTGP